MTNPLGVHFTPTHQGQHHYDFIRAMQPDLMKLVGSGQVGTPDVQIMADCYALAQGATHIYRNQPLSEQHDFLWRDPAGAAVEHVATMARELEVRVQEAKQRGLELPDREQWRILGINEPVIELFPRNEDMSNYEEWLAMVNHRSALLDTYMDVFMLESDKHNLRCFVGNFSGGQPANKKPGEYATYDWFPKTRKRIEASNKRHGLGVHEYWDIPGPEEMANWWTWRWKHCDWDCEIGTLENGIDRQIRGKDFEGNRGWIGHMEAPAYVDQHRRYMLPCLEDERFIGATPFTLDGGKTWASFYIEPCMPQMVALANELRQHVKPAPAPTPPNTTHLPSIGSGPAVPIAPPVIALSDPSAVSMTAAGARIRRYPGVTSDILGAVPLYTILKVTGINEAGTWYRVESPFGVGWVSGTVVAVHNVAGVPVVETGVEPATTPPAPSVPVQGDTWARSLAFVRRWEGDWADNPNDSGGATMKGITIGTYRRWRDAQGQPPPTKAELRAITDEEVNRIYFEWYWKASGSDKLPWPLALANFDTSVNAGPGKAAEMLAKSGGDFQAYVAHLLIWYTTLEDFEHFGRAWTRRRAELLLEANE